MSENKGWYAVDLDGTLAFYDEWRGADHIGAPIIPMALTALYEQCDPKRQRNLFLLLFAITLDLRRLTYLRQNHLCKF